MLGISQEEVPESGIINALVKERLRELSLPDSEAIRWVAEQFAYTSFLMMYLKSGENVDVARGIATVPVTIIDFYKLIFTAIPAEVLVENS